jgi:hypothetical protein
MAKKKSKRPALRKNCCDPMPRLVGLNRKLSACPVSLMDQFGLSSQVAERHDLTRKWVPFFGIGAADAGVTNQIGPTTSSALTQQNSSRRLAIGINPRQSVALDSQINAYR